MRRFVVILVTLFAGAAAFAADRPAKQLFGALDLPDALASEPIGFYSRGCMAGAEQLAPDGPHWQAMRLSRNRQWGQPVLIDFLHKLAQDAATQDGWPGLLVGDLSQPRGGPMASGHASHQIGLDADIWLTPMPNRRLTARQREDMSAVSVVEPGPHEISGGPWTAAHGRLIRRAALDRRVERIFVAPGIKRKLCETATGDRGWLRKVRPYYGHNDHIHVRLSCPAGTPCRSQDATPPGDGCGEALDYWFTDAPYRPAPPSTEPPKEIMLSGLPPACRQVLNAEARPGAMTMRQAFDARLSGVVPATAAAAAAPAAAAFEPRPPMRRPKR
jgi:penicillin-insensitive murein endopeptidase